MVRDCPLQCSKAIHTSTFLDGRSVLLMLVAVRLRHIVGKLPITSLSKGLKQGIVNTMIAQKAKLQERYFLQYPHYH